MPRHHVNRALRIFPKAEAYEPAFNRGELRLAAEAMLAGERGRHVPAAAHVRAMDTLMALAK